MTSKIKKIVFVPALMLVSFSVLFAAPNPGGKGKISSYTSPMTHPGLTSNVKFPYPTNKWYGSIYTKHLYHDYSYRMSAYPMVVNLNTTEGSVAQGAGYLLGYPDFVSDQNSVKNEVSPIFFALISAKKNGTSSKISSSRSYLDGYSDWSATFMVQDSADNSKWMKTTIGKGFVFTYNEYSEGLTPTISVYKNASIIKAFNLQNAQIPAGVYQGDCVLIKTFYNSKAVYYAVYAPSSSTFTIGDNEVSVSFASSERYLSIALITKGQDTDTLKNNAVMIFNEYYKYAYNFITDTKVSYSYDETNSKVTTLFDFTTVAKRSGAPFDTGTVFSLFPHQWKNATSETLSKLKPDTYNYKTMRGVMKTGVGTSFSTENKFLGILPNLSYEIPAASKNKMQNYINDDKNFNAVGEQGDTYYSGKALAKAANLIPIFHQFGDMSSRNQMIERLKAQLQLWYTASGEKYFGYDTNWGGLIGVPFAFTSEYYADHHFHYGYFVYASAILSLFDTNFAAAGEFKGMVDLLVKDYANHQRNDSDFPFLRNFDVYEGHSWANGSGGGSFGDRGIDQESSSEAMNAWAAIYLWGIASKNQDLISLGAYGYSTEYEATKEYYFDVSGEIYGDTAYGYKGIGILFDNWSVYGLHFPPTISQTIKGIQVLPLTPSMLYLGYDSAYAKAYYEEMLTTADTGAHATLWKDIWLRYKALYDGAGALSDFERGGFLAEGGSSLTYSYQFINFFNTYGQVDTSIVCDNGSFLVTNKNGQKNYFAFNSSTDSFKTVVFKNVSGANTVGSMKVPPMTTAITKDFTNFEYDSLRTFYADGKNYVCVLDKYSAEVKISSASISQTSSSGILPFAFKVNIPSEYSDGVMTYIRVSDISVPAGYNADNIKLAVYNSQTGSVDYNFPQQSLEVETDSQGKESVFIKAKLQTNADYVLVAGFSLFGEVLFKGQGINEIKINLYDIAEGSTQTVKTQNGGKFSLSLSHAKSYILSAESSTYDFVNPVRYIDNVGSDISEIFYAKTSENKFIVYPNPYKPSQHGHIGITFSGLKNGAQIKIYNIAGECIFDAKMSYDGDFVWFAENRSGNQAGSGVYIYHIKSGKDVRKGKVAVIR